MENENYPPVHLPTGRLPVVQGKEAVDIGKTYYFFGIFGAMSQVVRSGCVMVFFFCLNFVRARPRDVFLRAYFMIMCIVCFGNKNPTSCHNITEFVFICTGKVGSNCRGQSGWECIFCISFFSFFFEKGKVRERLFYFRKKWT